MTRIAAPTQEALVPGIPVTNKAWLIWFQKVSEYLDSGTPGPQGERGPIGTTPTVIVGDVEALETGEEAYVTNVGTAKAAVLNFGLPKGNTGAKVISAEWDGDDMKFTLEDDSVFSLVDAKAALTGPTGSGGSDFLIMQVFGG